MTGIVVDDYYVLKDGRLVLSASHTPAFDAGLGHIPGRGVVHSDDAHGYWITGIDEPVANNTLVLRVGSLRVNHRLVVAGITYSLSEKAAGERVFIRVLEKSVGAVR